MYRITKKHRFDAAHQLKGLPDDHPCSRLHGHSYTVELVLEADEVDDIGFVQDYGDLGKVFSWIDRNWDHRNLNDEMEENTTAENIARFLFDRFKIDFPKLAEVRVSETAKTWAIYREGRV